MRFADVLRFALSALYQQKVRTLLTMAGVVIGAFVLVMSLSIGEGVRDVALRQFRKHDQLRKIEVLAGYGDALADIPPAEIDVKGKMSDGKRSRIREALVRKWYTRRPRKVRVPLTRERVEALASLPHVQSVVPAVQFFGRASYGGKSEEVSAAALTSDNTRLRERLVAGDVFPSADAHAVIVSEFLLYEWGITDDADVAGVVGKAVRLDSHFGPHSSNMLLSLLQASTANQLTAEEERVLDKAAKQMPAAVEKLDLTSAERATLQRLLRAPPPEPERTRELVVGQEFTIVGVVRGPTKREQQEFSFGGYLERAGLEADVILPLRTGEELFAKAPAFGKGGFDRVTLTVDSEENVKAVSEEVSAMGLNRFSLAELVERIRVNILLVSLATSFVAGVALLVAALGITNTMLMSVLERTREIGVMKAVGARDRHIQLIFVIEGAVIGVVGGALGLLAGWLASFPGDAVARKVMLQQTGTQLEESLFVFPLWLTLGIPAFAALVTTLAAVYPARRAARVNPIAALRHE